MFQSIDFLHFPSKGICWLTRILMQPPTWPQDPSQYAGYYGYTQAYENYPYAAIQPDAGQYTYESYGGYPNYPQQVYTIDENGLI